MNTPGSERTQRDVTAGACVSTTHLLALLLALSGHELGDSTAQCAVGVGRKQTDFVGDRADAVVQNAVCVRFGFVVLGSAGQEVFEVLLAQVEELKLCARFLKE